MKGRPQHIDLSVAIMQKKASIMDVEAATLRQKGQ
jgi:hypothetical protein